MKILSKIGSLFSFLIYSFTITSCLMIIYIVIPYIVTIKDMWAIWLPIVGILWCFLEITDLWKRGKG